MLHFLFKCPRFLSGASPGSAHQREQHDDWKLSGTVAFASENAHCQIYSINCWQESFPSSLPWNSLFGFSVSRWQVSGEGHECISTRSFLVFVIDRFECLTTKIQLKHHYWVSWRFRERRYSYQKHWNISSGYNRPRETLTCTPLDCDTYLNTKMAIANIVMSREITLY